MGIGSYQLLEHAHSTLSQSAGPLKLSCRRLLRELAIYLSTRPDADAVMPKTETAHGQIISKHQLSPPPPFLFFH